MDANSASRELVALARGVVYSLTAPPLARFRGLWPAADSSPARSIAASTLPVLRWLPRICAAAHPIADALVSALCRNAGSLAWHQTYTRAELDEAFFCSYGYTEIIGPSAPLPCERIACGFLLLGPSTFYPRHRHEAEEIYIPLSGTAHWQQGDAIWRERPSGSVIYHASEEPHAMRTDAEPLLALYLWRSDELNQKSRLDPAPVPAGATV